MIAARWDANDWLRMLMELGVRGVTAAKWATPFADEVQPDRFSAGMADLVPFVATFLHETGGKGENGRYGPLERLVEDMAYSTARICAVWPARFPTTLDAAPYAYNDRALANKVYGGRMGNTEPDDGYNFRGRAAGITGRRNYTWLGDKWGQDLTVSPQTLEQPHFAIQGSMLVWEGLVPDRDLSDLTQVRRDYNGGLIGADACRDLANLCTKVIA